METDPAVQRIHPPFSTPGEIRPDAREAALFKILAVFGVLFWSALTVLTLGTIWLLMALLYLLMLTTVSCLIAHVRGNGVRVGERQFPELEARFNACCLIAGLARKPRFYLLNGNGVLNAFASRFLRRYYVVLLSDIVDALEDDQEALNFYIGHELGHIAHKHLAHRWWIGVAMFTPLLGAAYARAREYTCDQYGLACCRDTRSAMHALAVLAAGGKRWKSMHMDSYIAQGEDGGGFWMSLNELTADYPGLCKRIARVQRGEAAVFPRRHWLAWGIAAFLPRTGFGLIGGIVMHAYLLTCVALLVLPRHAVLNGDAAELSEQSSLSDGYTIAMAAAKEVELFVERQKRLPDSLEQAGFSLPAQGAVRSVDIARDGGILTVRLAPPHATLALYLTPLKEGGKWTWVCSASERIAMELLPAACQAHEGGGGPLAGRAP
ncbi:MAG TPA: hypothetical protein DCW29_18770 [Janthinobacterium sp.]|nr:hypothetical protein [Janthinobacterium sp.]